MRYNIQIILAACILMGTFTMSCRDGRNQSTIADPTAYRKPVTKSFEFTEAKQIEWEVTDPDSIAPPKTYPLDIDKLPFKPFRVSEFKPLTSPMKEYTLIIPPWWRTWWAYLGYTLLGISGIWLIVQFRSNQLQRENRLLEEKVSSRTKKLRESIDSLKATQAQLIQSEKMASLGELTAGIAHEIQNPLNFVNNFSELNQELADELEEELNKGDIEEAKAIAKDIKANESKINHHGKRADAIVKGMLQHSRTSSAEKEPTEINKLADEYLRLAYHGLRAKDQSFNATLETDFDESIGMVDVIPQDMGRVILNLITNAFYACNAKKSTYAKTSADGEKTTKEEGYKPTVSVSTMAEADNVKITVKDNGNGIPKDVIEKIFQPFFTTKPTGEGTGLGLSMSYDIVTKGHGGDLNVNTKEGEGTSFIITLPKK